MITQPTAHGHMGRDWVLALFATLFLVATVILYRTARRRHTHHTSAIKEPPGNTSIAAYGATLRHFARAAMSQATAMCGNDSLGALRVRGNSSRWQALAVNSLADMMGSQS